MADDEPGEIEQAVDALLAGLDLQPGDPRLVLAEGAVLLALRADMGEVAAWRDLRITLRQMGVADRPPPPPRIEQAGPDTIERVRAKRAARRARYGLSTQGAS